MGLESIVIVRSLCVLFVRSKSLGCVQDVIEGYAGCVKGGKKGISLYSNDSVDDVYVGVAGGRVRRSTYGGSLLRRSL